MKVWSYSQSYRIEGKGELVARSDKFFEAAECAGVSMDTVRSYAYALLAFFRWIEADWGRFERADQKTLQDWLHAMRAQGLKPRSINQRLAALRAFYRFCFGKIVPHAAGVLYPLGHYKGARKQRMGLSTPARRTFLELRAKVPHEVLDPLKPPEIDAFLRTVRRYRDMGIVLTMLLCGLRSQEVLSTRLEDLDFHQNQIRVRGKGNRERIVPMPFRLMQLFERYLEMERPTTQDERFFVILQGSRSGLSMTRAGLRRLFRYRREKLGIPKLKPHQFRHAFASDLARAGVPLTTIQRLLGHSDIQTSLIYIELVLDDIRADYNAAIKRIEERYAAFSKSPTP